jgi:hypothetical protein
VVTSPAGAGTVITAELPVHAPAGHTGAAPVARIPA